VPAVVATVALAVVVLNTGVEILPGDALISVLNPLRLVVLTGLVALAAGGMRVADVRSPLDLPVGLLLTVAAGVTVLGGHPLAPLRGLLTVVGVFVLAVGVLRRVPGAQWALLCTALLAAVVPATVGLVQAAQGTQTGFARVGFDRAVGTFANPNLLAAYLVLLAPFAVVAIFGWVRSAERPPDGSVEGRAAIFVVVIGVLALGLLVTMSRTALLAAVAGGLALGLVRWVTGRLSPRLGSKVAQKAGRHRREGPPTVFLMAPVFGLVGFLALAAVLVARASGRAEVWALALHVGLRHAVAGVGLGGAGAALNAINPGRIEKVYYHAHNLWLNWFVEAGIPGLAAITVLTVVSLVLAVRAAATGTPLGAATLVSVVGFLVVCLADHPAAIDRLETAWWVVLGVAATAQAPKALAGAPRRGKPEPERDDDYVSANGLPTGSPVPEAQVAATHRNGSLGYRRAVAGLHNSR
jgi:O-antigen ligase